MVAPPGSYQVVIRKDLEDKSYWYYEAQIRLSGRAAEKIEAKLELTYTEPYYYEKARKSNTAADLEEYLKSFPDGPHADNITQGLASLKQRSEDELYGKVKDGSDPKAFSAFLSKYPRSRRTEELKDRFRHLLDRNYKDKISGIEMVFVKGGCYMMGDTFDGGNKHERPVHKVCVNNFYIGKYKITQGQWNAIMGNNSSKFGNCGDDCPVERVSYNDVQNFLGKLNDMTGMKFRLPTESEWEYAARSRGQKEMWAGSNNVGLIDEYGWYKTNSDSTTHPVGLKKPNGLGLYDMSGNVLEWVQDWYHDAYYEESPHKNPIGPAKGDARVVRSGSWAYDAGYARTTARMRFAPDFQRSDLGFRVARTNQ